MEILSIQKLFNNVLFCAKTKAVNSIKHNWIPTPFSLLWLAHHQTEEVKMHGPHVDLL